MTSQNNLSKVHIGNVYYTCPACLLGHLFTGMELILRTNGKLLYVAATLRNQGHPVLMQHTDDTCAYLEFGLQEFVDLYKHYMQNP